MQIYKRIIGFCIGISVTLIMGILCAYFLTPSSLWYQNLVKPELNGDFFAFIWFFAYILFSIIIGDAVIERNAFFIFCSLTLVVLNILWCILFFTLHDLVTSLAVLLVECILIANTAFESIKQRDAKSFLLASLLIWYGYLFIQNFIITISNY